jgi:hypothetical protein
LINSKQGGKLMSAKQRIFKTGKRIIIYLILSASAMITGAHAAPVISSVSEHQTLYATNTTAALWAAVTPESEKLGISRVWAEIIPVASPGDRATLELSDPDNDRIYEGVYEGFAAEGDYVITIGAEDTKGNSSFAQTGVTVIRESMEPDSYEDDDTAAAANIIVIGNESPQHHNFHDGGDADWVKFYGIKGQTYEIKVSNLNENYSIVIEFYDAALTPSTGEKGEGSLSCNPLSADGIYYVKLYEADSDSGIATGYDLEIVFKDAPAAAMFRFGGSVRSDTTDAPLGDVMIKTSGTGTLTDTGFSAMSDEEEDGNYVLYHSAEDGETFSPEDDAVTITARFPGYGIFSRQVFMTEDGFRVLPESENIGDETPGKSVCRDTLNIADLEPWDGVIKMVPFTAGDINGDGKRNLKDAVIALQVLAGEEPEEPVRPDYAESDADADRDKKIGMAEAISVLRYLAELK